MSALHHIELWVPDLAATRRSWGWLLGQLGWELDEFGPTSFALSHEDVYLFVRKDVAGLHQRRVDGDAALVVQVSLRDSRAVDLALENGAHAAPNKNASPATGEAS